MKRVGICQQLIKSGRLLTGGRRVSTVFERRASFLFPPLLACPSCPTGAAAVWQRWSSHRAASTLSGGAGAGQGSDGQPSDSASSPMSEPEFHAVSEQALLAVLEGLEGYFEHFDEEYDVEYSQGVLTLDLGTFGTYIINKQTPNRQIWMSSPVSGPIRYDYSNGIWKSTRDGHIFHRRLEAELANFTGEEVDLSPCAFCERLSTCTGDNAPCLDTKGKQ